jgi:protein-S-isoprenylcysteine O-methyltransferase Ste14
MRKRLTRWFLVSASVIGGLFISAGTWRDPWLWTYAAGWSAMVLYAMFSIDEDLAGRWHLTAPVPPLLRAFALGAMVVTFGMFFRAMRENRFFSSVVRVQSDRGHRVIDTGPYAIVRHPGYAGMILGMPFSGLALGSWVASAIGVVLSLLILRRVLFEDRFLKKNLNGYALYTNRVRYRLIPRVW